MKPIPKASYKTSTEIEARIREREAEANNLPPGEPRQSILKEVALLRNYADAKRWLETGRASK